MRQPQTLRARGPHLPHLICAQRPPPGSPPRSPITLPRTPAGADNRRRRLASSPATSRRGCPGRTATPGACVPAAAGVAWIAWMRRPACTGNARPAPQRMVPRGHQARLRPSADAQLADVLPDRHRARARAGWRAAAGRPVAAAGRAVGRPDVLPKRAVVCRGIDGSACLDGHRSLTGLGADDIVGFGQRHGARAATAAARGGAVRLDGGGG